MRVFLAATITSLGIVLVQPTNETVNCYGNEPRKIQQNASDPMKDKFHTARQRNVEQRPLYNEDSHTVLGAALEQETGRNESNPYLPEDVKCDPEITHATKPPHIAAGPKAETYYPVTGVMGYVSFRCAVREMKYYMEMVIYPTGYYVWTFNNCVSKHYPYPEPADLNETIASFTRAEKVESHAVYKEYDIGMHSAQDLIRPYFCLMYGFLSRCLIRRKDPWYNSQDDEKRARDLSAAVLTFYGLTKDDNPRAKEEILKRFSSSYARIRHGLNFLLKANQKLLKSNVNLLQRLYEAGVLDALHFSIEDLQIANTIRKCVDPTSAFEFVPGSYDFTIVNKSGEHVRVKGILPCVVPETGPHFAFPP